MDFIVAPLITFIVFAAIYGIFELLVRRRERMAIIEKMGDKLDPAMMEGKFNFGFLSAGKQSFGALKIACLLIGVGLGCLLGFAINMACTPGYGVDHWSDLSQMINGASILICGGLGLLIAFFMEMKYLRHKE